MIMNGKSYCINNFKFYIDKKNNMAEIQVADNWGNRIFLTAEEARRVYRAVKQGQISHPNRGKDTFQTIREIRRFLLGVTNFKED